MAERAHMDLQINVNTFKVTTKGECYFGLIEKCGATYYAYFGDVFPNDILFKLAGMDAKEMQKFQEMTLGYSDKSAGDGDSLWCDSYEDVIKLLIALVNYNNLLCQNRSSHN